MASAKNFRTETLSLRLDPKTRFALDFISRVKGQSITSVVERSIKEVASETYIEGKDGEQKNWQSFWNVQDGIRLLELICQPNYPSTFEEDELFDFCAAHWQFFFVDAECSTAKTEYVEIAWPHIDEYKNRWAETKMIDYWGVGKTMADRITDSGLVAPEWPPE